MTFHSTKGEILLNINTFTSKKYMIVRVSLILSFTYHNTEEQLNSTAAVH